MDKSVIINKDQFVASVSTIAYMIHKTDYAPFDDVLMDFIKGLSPHLEDDWKQKVILTDYENIKYVGDKNE